MRTLLVLAAFALVALPAAAQSVAINAPAPERAGAAGSHYIVLHSGETVVGEVQVFPSADAPEYAVGNGRRYEMSQVRTFGTAEGEYAQIANGRSSQLLVKQESGRLSVYREAPGHRATGAEFFQVNDGPISMVTAPRLRTVMADDPAALSHLQRERAYGAIGWGGLLVGAGMVATGAALELGDLGPNGIRIAASGVLLAASVNAVVPVLQRNARQSAIRTYNR
jgi:hypothetical protein